MAWCACVREREGESGVSFACAVSLPPSSCSLDPLPDPVRTARPSALFMREEDVTKNRVRPNFSGVCVLVGVRVRACVLVCAGVCACVWGVCAGGSGVRDWVMVVVGDGEWGPGLMESGWAGVYVCLCVHVCVCEGASTSGSHSRWHSLKHTRTHAGTDTRTHCPSHFPPPLGSSPLPLPPHSLPSLPSFPCARTPPPSSPPPSPPFTTTHHHSPPSHFLHPALTTWSREYDSTPHRRS